jgi:hypothetical protein
MKVTWAICWFCTQYSDFSSTIRSSRSHSNTEPHCMILVPIEPMWIFLFQTNDFFLPLKTPKQHRMKFCSLTVHSFYKIDKTFTIFSLVRAATKYSTFVRCLEWKTRIEKEYEINWCTLLICQKKNRRHFICTTSACFHRWKDLYCIETGLP